MSRRALIVGGSMAGLCAGLFLRQRGWSVDIYERSSEELTSRGAGIVSHPELLALLSDAGARTDTEFGIPVEDRRVVDRAGKIIARFRYPQIATSWTRLLHMLGDAFPREHYHLGKNVTAIFSDAQRVQIDFADGTSAAGDLLVGADGVRSTVRSFVSREAEPLYAGYVGWRALVRERDVPADLHGELFSTMLFCLPSGEQIISYPVAGPGDDLRPGHRSLNLIWYVPAEEGSELDALLTDIHGTTHSGSIPPPLIRPEIIAAMRAHAEEVLAPQFRALLPLAPQTFLQPIYDFESQHMVRGRIALIGDAAFVARPHVGAGVYKAAGDAHALSAALGEGRDIDAGLRRFEAERLPIGRRIVDFGRYLGHCLRDDFYTESRRLAAAHHRSPLGIIEETARLAFLCRNAP
ncbi:MAG: FAD binding domain-containing protein [Methylobacteriaceae bacterium]|nr:FAD binding domain-containing protein [Methylobacteriaceae bacterium]